MSKLKHTLNDVRVNNCLLDAEKKKKKRLNLTEKNS